MRWLNRALIVGPYLTLCLNERDYKRAMRKVQAPEPYRDFVSRNGAQATTHLVDTNRGMAAIVCLKPPLSASLIDIHALLAHEAVHVWQEFRREIGESSPSDEFESYSIQSIARTLFLEYERLTHPRPRKRRQ